MPKKKYTRKQLESMSDKELLKLSSDKQSSNMFNQNRTIPVPYNTTRNQTPISSIEPISIENKTVNGNPFITERYRVRVSDIYKIRFGPEKIKMAKGGVSIPSVVNPPDIIDKPGQDNLGWGDTEWIQGADYVPEDGECQDEWWTLLRRIAQEHSQGLQDALEEIEDLAWDAQDGWDWNNLAGILTSVLGMAVPVVRNQDHLKEILQMWEMQTLDTLQSNLPNCYNCGLSDQWGGMCFDNACLNIFDTSLSWASGNAGNQWSLDFSDIGNNAIGLQGVLGPYDQYVLGLGFSDTPGEGYQVTLDLDVSFPVGNEEVFSCDEEEHCSKARNQNECNYRGTWPPDNLEVDAYGKAFVNCCEWVGRRCKWKEDCKVNCEGLNTGSWPTGVQNHYGAEYPNQEPVFDDLGNELFYKPGEADMNMCRLFDCYWDTVYPNPIFENTPPSAAEEFAQDSYQMCTNLGCHVFDTQQECEEPEYGAHFINGVETDCFWDSETGECYEEVQVGIEDCYDYSRATGTCPPEEIWQLDFFQQPYNNINDPDRPDCFYDDEDNEWLMEAINTGPEAVLEMYSGNWTTWYCPTNPTQDMGGPNSYVVYGDNIEDAEKIWTGQQGYNACNLWGGMTQDAPEAPCDGGCVYKFRQHPKPCYGCHTIPLGIPYNEPCFDASGNELPRPKCYWSDTGREITSPHNRTCLPMSQNVWYQDWRHFCLPGVPGACNNGTSWMEVDEPIHQYMQSLYYCEDNECTDQEDGHWGYGMGTEWTNPSVSDQFGSTPSGGSPGEGWIWIPDGEGAQGCPDWFINTGPPTSYEMYVEQVNNCTSPGTPQCGSPCWDCPYYTYGVEDPLCYCASGSC